MTAKRTPDETAVFIHAYLKAPAWRRKLARMILRYHSVTREGLAYKYNLPEIRN